MYNESNLIQDATSRGAKFEIDNTGQYCKYIISGPNNYRGVLRKVRDLYKELHHQGNIEELALAFLTDRHLGWRPKGWK